MAYIVAEPCIGVKDAACVDACPVDCIHPRKDEASFAEAEIIYIDPVECIDCGVVRPSVPRFGDLRPRRSAGEVGTLYTDKRRLPSEKAVAH